MVMIFVKGTNKYGEMVVKCGYCNLMQLNDSEKPRGDEPIKYVCMYVMLDFYFMFFALLAWARLRSGGKRKNGVK